MPFSKRQVEKLLDGDLIPAGRVPGAMRVSESYLKRRLWAVEDAAVKNTLRLYKVAYFDLVASAQDVADRLGVEALGRDRASARFREAYSQQVVDRLTRLGQDAAAEGLRAASAAWMGAYYGKAWQMDTGTVAEFTPRFQRVDNRKAIDRAVNFIIREDVYDDAIRSLLGAQWRQQYADEMDDLILRIRRAVLAGMDAGEGIDALNRRVRDAMGVQTNISAGYRANFNRIQTITRTLTNQISNDGAVDIFRQNADVLTGYEWLTARDERVCARCRSLDRTVYALGEQIRPPAHPQCRCTVIPRIDPALLLPGSQAPGLTFSEWLAAFGLVGMVADYLKPRDLETERFGDSYGYTNTD